MERSSCYTRDMTLPVRKRLPHQVPQWVSEGSFFFITINCEPRGQNHLCKAGIGETILDAARHNHERLVWYCRLMLLMPDHLHGIIAFPIEPGIKMTVTHWKRYVAFHYGVSWQRDFFDHRLRSHHEVEEKSSYILMNPVRKGLCERPEEWSWLFRPADRPPPSL